MLFFSCKKSGNPLQGVGAGVYVTGTDGVNPFLWSSGGTKQLANNGGLGMQVLLAGGNVYVAGVTNDRPGPVITPGGPGGQYTLWKNGAETFRTPLQLINSPSIAMTVSGNDVYFCSWTLYKNDSPFSLPGQGAGYFVSAAASAGSDIYFAGHDSAYDACYWKNGVLHVLEQNQPTGSGIQISSIFVSGTDVYVAGSDQLQSAVIWINGMKTVLQSSDGERLYNVQSIFVQGKDLYWIGNREAAYWKNGVKTLLSTQGAQPAANSIFVSGTDVYVAGEDSNRAVLWKNGVETVLASGGEAYSVAVKP